MYTYNTYYIISMEGLSLCGEYFMCSLQEIFLICPLLSFTRIAQSKIQVSLMSFCPFNIRAWKASFARVRVRSSDVIWITDIRWNAKRTENVILGNPTCVYFTCSSGCNTIISNKMFSARYLLNQPTPDNVMTGFIMNYVMVNCIEGLSKI